MSLLKKIFSGMAVLLALPLSAQVLVDMKLDTTAIVVGQQVQLSATVTADATSQIKFPVYKERQELVKGIEVVGRSPYDTTYLNDRQRMEVTCRYRITSFDSALYSLPPIEVEVDGKVHKAKAPLGLKVDVVPVDTTQVDRFPGPHGITPGQFEWRNRLWLMALGAWPLLFLVVFAGIRLTRRKPLTKKVVHKEVVPPNREAVQLLKSLETTPDLEQKDRFIQLTELLRNYLFRRFGVQALELTSDQILAAMNGRVGEAELEDLRLVFETADLVKFAKLVVTDYECDRCLKAAADFLERTIDEAMEHPEPQVEIVVLNDGMQRRHRNLLWGALGLSLVGGIAYVLYVSYVLLHTYY